MCDDSKPKELIDALHLKEEGKFKEALQIINSIEKNKDLTVDNQISTMLLKSTILNRLAQYDDALRLAKKVYQECQRLGNTLQSLDAHIEMAEAIVRLGRLDNSLDVIAKSEALLNKITSEIKKELTHREASLAFLRGYIYYMKGELDRAQKYTAQSLALQEGLGNEREVARSLTQLGGVLVFKGDMDRGFGYLERSMTIEENSFNSNKVQTLLYIGNFYSLKGDLERGLDCYKKSLGLAKEMNDTRNIALSNLTTGVIYRKKGELNLAVEHLKRSLELFERIGQNYFNISCALDELFEIALDKNDLESAQHYLQHLEQIKDQDNSKSIHSIYRVDKALMLKKSPRARNRAKAEEILKHIVEEELVLYEVTVNALLNLCDLLLIELRVTSDLEILDELQPYITQLLGLAEKNRSYSLLSETYLLQARLALLTLDIKEARRYLTQAQQIAERWGLNQLAKKISSEHDELISQLNVWERLKESNAPLIERMELARFEEQMEQMIRKRAIISAQITEEKVTIHKEKKICVVCRGEVLGFTYICKCDAIYCDNCARALVNLENAC